MTSLTRSTRRSRSRVTIAAGLVAFLTLAGTAGAEALWTAPATTLTASATSGSISITQTGFDALAVTYNQATTTKTAPVTVTNTSAVAGNYSLSLSAAPATGLAPAVVLKAWKVASAAASDCRASTAIPVTGVTTGSLASIPAITDTAAAGASVYYCVRTTLAQVNASNLGQATATLASGLSLSGTNWTTSATGAAIQTAVDTERPTVPGKPAASNTTGTQTTLTWAASTDNVGVVAYDIYRGDVLVGPSATTSFTDTGLSTSTTYTYKLVARDAAGNASMTASAGTSVTTAAIDSSGWYKLTTTNGLCVDGDQGINPSNTTTVIAFGCKTANANNQNWQFVPSGSNFRIVARYASTYALSVANGNNNSPVTISNGSGNNQLWTLTSLGGGKYQIKNVGNSRCLYSAGTASAQLTVQTCSTTAPVASTQTFTLGLVG